MLGVSSCEHFRSPLDRPNLYLEVRFKQRGDGGSSSSSSSSTRDNDNDNNEDSESGSDILSDIARTIKSLYAGQSGIVYCCSRKDSEHVADQLSKRGINAHAYVAKHASILTLTHITSHKA